MITNKKIMFTNKRAERLAEKIKNLPMDRKAEMIAMMEEMLKKEEKKG